MHVRVCNDSQEMLEDLIMSSSDLSVMLGLTNLGQGNLDTLLQRVAQPFVFTVSSCQPGRSKPVDIVPTQTHVHAPQRSIRTFPVWEHHIGSR